jgi:hypothetical protein
MVDTGFNGDPVPVERLAIGYGARSDGTVNAPPYWGPTSWLVMGSGGQISTTRDTSRFLVAMREGKILEPELARRFFGPGPGANRNGDAYGFEMFVYHSPMAESHAVLITNANDPRGVGDDGTQFVRVAGRIGDMLLDQQHGDAAQRAQFVCNEKRALKKTVQQYLEKIGIKNRSGEFYRQEITLSTRGASANGDTAH